MCCLCDVFWFCFLCVDNKRHETNEMSVANRYLDKIINQDIFAYLFSSLSTSGRAINHNYSTTSSRISSMSFNWWNVLFAWRFVVISGVWTILKSDHHHHRRKALKLIDSFRRQANTEHSCLYFLSLPFLLKVHRDTFSFLSLLDTNYSLAYVSMRKRSYRMRKVSSKNAPLSNVPSSNGPRKMPGCW